MNCQSRQLNDADRLIRHCPKRFEDGGVFSAEAFWFSNSDLKKDNPYLSFNWLEKICQDAQIPTNPKSALDELQCNFPHDIKKGEWWLILSCERIRAAIRRVPNCCPSILHCPDCQNPSHAAVSGYEKPLYKTVAAELLIELESQPNNIYPVTKTVKKNRKS